VGSLSSLMRGGGHTVDLSKFSEINETYERFFGKHKPARVTVGVKELPLRALVEIEAIAVREI